MENEARSQESSAEAQQQADTTEYTGWLGFDRLYPAKIALAFPVLGLLLGKYLYHHSVGVPGNWLPLTSLGFAVVMIPASLLCRPAKTKRVGILLSLGIIAISLAMTSLSYLDESLPARGMFEAPFGLSQPNSVKVEKAYEESRKAKKSSASVVKFSAKQEDIEQIVEQAELKEIRINADWKQVEKSFYMYLPKWYRPWELENVRVFAVQEYKEPDSASRSGMLFWDKDSEQAYYRRTYTSWSN